jgi:hypothetical protein
MDRRRMLINAGFALFPALLSVAYYVIVSASRLESVPQPSELGSKVLAYLLAFPNSEWVNLGDVRMLLLLISFLFLGRAVQEYRKAASIKAKEAQLAYILLTVFVSLIIIFTPYIVKASFSILSAIEGTLRAKTAGLLALIKDEVVFIVPMTALTLLRYFFLVLLSLLLPLALVLCIAKATRSIGAILLEQTFMWTIASEIALTLLVMVDALASLIKPSENSTIIFLTVFSAAIVVVSPLITLFILQMAEKLLGVLSNAVENEYQETYGKGAA